MCVHDSNAILVKFEDGVLLGHLEEYIALAIAPLIDQNLPEFIIRRYITTIPSNLFVHDMH